MTTKSTPRISAQFKKDLLKQARELRHADPELAEGMEDVAYGRVISHEELWKKLGH
jgi:predicted transcriptional regulator